MGEARDNKLIKLLDLILDASAESVQTLSCPFCNGALGIQFVSVQSDRSYRKSRKNMSLHVHCKECPWDSVADGLPREPPWVEKLGPRIQTSVTVLDGHRAGNKRAVPQTKGAADDLLALRKAKRSERKKKSIPLAKVKRGLGLR